MMFKSIFPAAILLIVLQGCAAIVNPYDSEFQCPDVYMGKCTSLPNAYRESVEGVDPKLTNCPGGECANVEVVAAAAAATKVSGQKTPQDAKSQYQDALYTKLQNRIEEPLMPHLMPLEPKRVLILDYESEGNVLMGHRFVYFVDEKPKWIYAPME